MFLKYSCGNFRMPKFCVSVSLRKENWKDMDKTGHGMDKSDRIGTAIKKVDACTIFSYSLKILQYMLHLHLTILSNYYINYTKTTGTGPQGKAQHTINYT